MYSPTGIQTKNNEQYKTKKEKQSMIYSAATCVHSSKAATAMHQLLGIAHLVLFPLLLRTSEDPRAFGRTPRRTSSLLRKSVTRKIQKRSWSPIRYPSTTTSSLQRSLVNQVQHYFWKILLEKQLHKTTKPSPP